VETRLGKMVKEEGGSFAERVEYLNEEYSTITIRA